MILEIFTCGFCGKLLEAIRGTFGLDTVGHLGIIHVTV